MADQRPFTAFNFRVEIEVGSALDGLLCEASFAECDGLEVAMEPKSFWEGGHNTGKIHLAGPVAPSQLTLRRGMSTDFGLWRWFGEVMKTDMRGLRGSAMVLMLAADRREQVRFKLHDCLPVKLRAPALNAREGLIAIEEMSIAYRALDVEFPS